MRLLLLSMISDCSTFQLFRHRNTCWPFNFLDTDIFVDILTFWTQKYIHFLDTENSFTFRKFDPGKRARELFNALDVDGEPQYFLILVILILFQWFLFHFFWQIKYRYFIWLIQWYLKGMTPSLNLDLNILFKISFKNY